MTQPPAALLPFANRLAALREGLRDGTVDPDSIASAIRATLEVIPSTSELRAMYGMMHEELEAHIAALRDGLLILLDGIEAFKASGRSRDATLKSSLIGLRTLLEGIETWTASGRPPQRAFNSALSFGMESGNGLARFEDHPAAKIVVEPAPAPPPPSAAPADASIAEIATPDAPPIDVDDVIVPAPATGAPDFMLHEAALPSVKIEVDGAMEDPADLSITQIDELLDSESLGIDVGAAPDAGAPAKTGALDDTGQFAVADLAPALHAAEVQEVIAEKPPEKERVAPDLSGVVQVLYATDRRVRSEKNPLRVEFAAGRGAKALTFGVAEVSIPPTHMPGSLERPSIWRFEFREDRRKHVVIDSCQIKDEAEWKRIARARMDKTGEKSALVFIHGFNVAFDDAILRAAQLGKDLQFEGLITAYSWSSEETMNPLGYLADGENIKLTVPLLRKFLLLLRNDLRVATVHIVAHSMGNRALLKALETSPRTGAKSLRLSEVVFAAPDVDADEFRLAARELRGKAKRYTLYGSGKDRALKASKTFRKGYPRAGDGGRNIVVVDGVDTIDASAAGKDLLDLHHSDFAKATLLADLNYVVRTPTPADRRWSLYGNVLERMGTRLKYWVLKVKPA